MASAFAQGSIQGPRMHILSVGLEHRSPEMVMDLLCGQGVQAVVDIRADGERREPGPFHETDLAALLHRHNIEYLTLRALLESPEYRGQYVSALEVALCGLLAHACRKQVALLGAGQDPDAWFGPTTLITECIERGISVEWATEQGAFAPVVRQAFKPSPPRRASSAITRGVTFVAAGVAAVGLLGILMRCDGAAPPQDTAQTAPPPADQEEFMVSNIHPGVIYDTSGTPYRKGRDGYYAPLTEQDVADLGQGTGAAGTSVTGPGAHVFLPYSYWDFRNEGQSFRAGTAQPRMRLGLSRGGFGSSATVHAPPASAAEAVRVSAGA